MPKQTEKISSDSIQRLATALAKAGFTTGHENAEKVVTSAAEYVERLDGETNLSRAVDTLTKALREDEAFYFAYQSNIAMAFYDTAMSADITREDLLHIANEGAKRFLDLFIREKHERKEIDKNIERNQAEVSEETK